MDSGVPRWDYTWRRRSWWWRCRGRGSGLQEAGLLILPVRSPQRQYSGTFRSMPISILTRSPSKIICWIVFRQHWSISRRWQAADQHSTRHSFSIQESDLRSISKFQFLAIFRCCCACRWSIFERPEWVFPRFCIHYSWRCPGCSWVRFGRWAFDRSFPVRAWLSPNIFQNFMRWNLFWSIEIPHRWGGCLKLQPHICWCVYPTICKHFDEFRYQLQIWSWIGQ